MRLPRIVQSGPVIAIRGLFGVAQGEKNARSATGDKSQKRAERKRWVVNPPSARSHFRPLARIVFLHEFRISSSIARSAHTFPHEHTSTSQNGRSLRCRPRPQQGPRGLHRQGRQHQLHDGVAAPRQQVSTGFRPRPAFPGYFPILATNDTRDRGACAATARDRPREDG